MARALIIDDEIDICFLLSSILRRQQLQVSVVNTLSEATTALAKQEPEIIFLDNHLPDGLGVDYISKIKALHPGVKIAMITAYDNFLDRTKAIFNGADTFIPKPFTREVINQTVDKLLPVC
jgi:two-component system OmpR family response regulator